MNVAVLSGIDPSAAGVFYAVNPLVKSLVEQGVEISVLGRASGEYGDAFLRVWHPARPFAYRAHGPLGSSLGVRKLLAGLRPELVHQHGLWLDDQWATLQWQKRKKGPVVISPHGMLDPWAVKHSQWKKRLAGALFANESLRRATCIHALCRSELESIRAYGLKNPVAVIPNGVDLPEMPGAREEAKPFKQLLYLGRMHPKKGVKELIEAWAQFKKKGHGAHGDWRLLVAGWDDGGHGQALKTLATERGLGDREISFAGPVFGEEKEKLFRDSDAFVLASFSEGLPMAVLEAWAYGLPVLMTDFCNLPEGFEEGAALRIQPDASSIADALDQMAGMSESERGGMGKKGRQLVEKKFTWRMVAQDMHKVYEWCLGGGEPPPCLEFDDE